MGAVFLYFLKILSFLEQREYSDSLDKKVEQICRVCKVIHKLCGFLQSLFCQAFLFFFFNPERFFTNGKFKEKK